MYLEEVLNVKDNEIDGESGNLEKYRRRVSWVVSQLSPPTNSLPSSWSSCLNIQTMKLVAFRKKLILLQLGAGSHVSIWLKTCCVFFHGHCHLPHRSAGAGRHLRPTLTLAFLSLNSGSVKHWKKKKSDLPGANAITSSMARSGKSRHSWKQTIDDVQNKSGISYFCALSRILT